MGSQQDPNTAPARGLMPLAKSFSAAMRKRRFARFERFIEDVPRPLRVLDVGGTEEFWVACGWAGRPDVTISLLNLTRPETTSDNVEPLAGDATNLAEFDDGSFDVVFSNSVIEHLFTVENQRAMAAEIQRVGRRYWVQTPNFWFPVEPHFHFIGWQWLPTSVRVAILRRRRCGWRPKTPDPAAARRHVDEVRLLTRAELSTLFPRARIEAERVLGLAKSWIVIGGSG